MGYIPRNFRCTTCLIIMALRQHFLLLLFVDANGTVVSMSRFNGKQILRDVHLDFLSLECPQMCPIPFL